MARDAQPKKKPARKGISSDEARERRDKWLDDLMGRFQEITDSIMRPAHNPFPQFEQPAPPSPEQMAEYNAAVAAVQQRGLLQHFYFGFICAGNGPAEAMHNAHEAMEEWKKLTPIEEPKTPGMYVYPVPPVRTH